MDLCVSLHIKIAIFALFSSLILMKWFHISDRGAISFLPLHVLHPSLNQQPHAQPQQIVVHQKNVPVKMVVNQKIQPIHNCAVSGPMRAHFLHHHLVIIGLSHLYKTQKKRALTSLILVQNGQSRLRNLEIYAITYN